MDQTEEAKARIEAFTKEYKELVDKHKVDFANWPLFSPTKDGKWEITLQSMPIDIKEQGIKSPFIMR